HIKNTIVVADGGLNTVPNIRRLDKRGHGFLMARSVPKMNKTLRDQLLSEDGWHDYNDGALRLKEIDVEIEGETDKNGVKGEPIKTRVIIGWSKKRYQEDQYRIAAHRKAAEQAVMEKKDMRSVSLGWKKYVKSKKSIASELNLRNIEKDEKIAGYFAYQFKDGREYDADWLKNPVGRVTAKEVMEQYHCLSKIEECFRIMKTNFDLRPLHVRTDVHIVAQVLICVLALVVIRVLAKKLEKAGHKMTIDEIIFALANAKVAALINSGNPALFAPISMERIKLSDGNYPKFKPYRHTPLSRIMDVVGLKPLPAYCCKNQLGKCLGTRFDTDIDAVGILDPKFLHNDTTKKSAVNS
ncbi:MAG: transposase, partial [Burkholderiales bacterium]|nr:transposase [Burkholderiales bacterium]